MLGASIALLLALACCLVIVARWLPQSFATIEDTATLVQARQLYQAFNTDLTQLSISTRDYAEWDDAAEFVAHGQRAFIDANISTETLSAMHVNLVWLLDSSGRELYSAFYDAASNRLTSPAPPSLLNQVGVAAHSDATLTAREPAQRLLHTTFGLLAFCTLEVKRTNRSAPTGAHLMFARLIGASDIARMRATFDHPINYRYLAGDYRGAVGEPSPALPLALLSRFSSTAGGNAFVWNTGQTRTTAYALARDLSGHPVAVFSSSAPRNIYSLGLHTTRLLIGSIAALLIGGSGCIAWLVVRLRRSFAATHAAERRYASIAAQLHETIILAEPGCGRIVQANGAVLSAMDCTQEAMLSRTVFDLYPDLTPAALEQLPSGANARSVLESRMRNRAGGTTDVEISITCMADAERVLWCLVGHDISHRREAERLQRASHRQLAHIAQHDALTGLPNRLYLRARLPRALRHAASAERLLALMYLDLDHFKNINDSRGHGAGDELLQVVAKRLRAAIAAQDVIVRMGGDEFVVVAALLPDVAAVDTLAARLLAAVQAPLVVGDSHLSITASIGVALHPRDGLDMEALLKHADIALYQAKAAGRDCFRTFSADMLVRVSETVAMEQALRHALGSDQFTMDYQPVIDMRSGRVASLEALMRWRHPELGLVPPGQFIPVADSSGLTVELGLQGLRIVLAQLRAWQDAEVPLVPVAVNISPVQLEQSDFCSAVLKLTAEYQIDTRWLRFEITETALLKDPEGLVGTLQTLRAQGSQVLIDDFGTGYSGLSYLSRLPVDSLKIDRSFVNDLGRNIDRTPIIGAIIDMARKLRLTTVAEGVETAEQAALLRDLHCDYAQGFWYSKPVSARHCQALLEKLGWEQPLTATLLTRVLQSA